MNSKPSEPFVVVLMLTYNGKNWLKDSIPSYLNNNYSNFRVVVVDNGSNEDLKKYVNEKFPKVDLIRLEKNRGYSGGFNFGFDYAVNKLDADFVLVTNDDVYADSKIIEELVRVAQEDDTIGFVTGKVYFYDSHGSKNILQTVGKEKTKWGLVGKHIGGLEKDVGQYDVLSERHFIDDVFTLVSRKVFEKTIGFDLNFFLQYEETDWQVRSKEHGFRILYTPEAKLWHRVGMSTGGTDSPLRHYYSKRNQILMVSRHSTSLIFFLFLLQRFFLGLPMQIISYVIKRRLDLVSASITGTFSGLIWHLKGEREKIKFE